MSISMLMIGKDEADLTADRELLKDCGIRVYTCTQPDNLPGMMEEVRPEVIFLNYPDSTQREMKTCRRLLDAAGPAHTPVIFTIAEDEAYLVSRRRGPWDKRWDMLMTDNILDALKQAFRVSQRPVSRQPFRMTRTIWLHPRLHVPASA